jgi:hypothetical protein
MIRMARQRKKNVISHFLSTSSNYLMLGDACDDHPESGSFSHRNSAAAVTARALSSFSADLIVACSGSIDAYYWV